MIDHSIKYVTLSIYVSFVFIFFIIFTRLDIKNFRKEPFPYILSYSTKFILLSLTLLTGCDKYSLFDRSTQSQSDAPHEPSKANGPPFSFRSVVKPAQMAIVNLYTTETLKQSKPSKANDISGVTLPPLPDRRAQSLGSGFIFDANAGYILTNWHVVKNAERIVARFADERSVFATLRGYDPNSDLAVLTIPTTQKLSSLSFAEDNSIEVGDWVIAIGNPFGLSNSVTAGIVSATGRQPMSSFHNVHREEGASQPNYRNFIQTDASINPGNSGGPLLDMHGRVVGINTAIYQQGTGLGFALPIETVKKQLPKLLEGGRIKKGWLGLYIDDLPEMALIEMGLTHGILITGVDEGSPAGLAGIQTGDILITFDKQKVESSQEVAWIASNMSPGESVSLEVLRSDKHMTFDVTLAERKKDDSSQEKDLSTSNK